ncbi:isoamylase early set domain-containing protein [Alteromonas sp. 5E99-2]|uniref:isoamylase early set domain-containing protein n=1 Tax=Alteromonas sp. 5E99-2 TaxID=2817683 RepID=UPI001A99953D|nr:isoamylase early set domain-containing protein [Alteromonas sp. 5E99-2]MBO1254846.1 isoamylase early set domain-containing protein [Alteromonas sp. 5E99-2]
MSIKKSFLKTKPVCKVTFRLTANESRYAETVKLLGEFNGWDESVSPMKKLKSGDFTQTLNLTVGKDYQFKYLCNSEKWENDWNADAYAPSPIPGADNSVVSI